jgi:hypothetical protein
MMSRKRDEQAGGWAGRHVWAGKDVELGKKKRKQEAEQAGRWAGSRWAGRGMSKPKEEQTEDLGGWAGREMSRQRCRGSKMMSDRKLSMKENEHEGRWACRWMSRQEDEQAGRWVGRRMSRQEDEQAETWTGRKSWKGRKVQIVLFENILCLGKYIRNRNSFSDVFCKLFSGRTTRDR